MKKNNIFVIGLLGYSVIALSGCAKHEIKNMDAKGKGIVCFGDSLTFGYGVNPGEDYPFLLAKITGLPVVNAGIDGDTTIEALRRIKSDVFGRDTFLVLVEFGGNDFLRKVPLAITADNIRKMIDEIQNKGLMVGVVDISAGLLLKEYHRTFRKIAREKGAIFISSVFNGIITNPRMKVDFFHPNGEGYKLVAQRIYHSIEPYLKKRTSPAS